MKRFVLKIKKEIDTDWAKVQEEPAIVAFFRRRIGGCLCTLRICPH